MPVGFVLGEKPELSTAAETRAFLTSRLLSTAPACCQGEICHIHLKTPHIRERNLPRSQMPRV